MAFSSTDTCMAMGMYSSAGGFMAEVGDWAGSALNSYLALALRFELWCRHCKG